MLAWIAAFFESALAIALWTSGFFSEAALLAAAYVLFLALAFHGPSRWTGNQTEFGFFVDHFFIAGLLFAAVHGPGDALVVRRSAMWRPVTCAPGLETTVYRNGVPDEEFMGHTRHRSPTTMRSYVRRAKLSQ